MNTLKKLRIDRHFFPFEVVQVGDDKIVINRGMVYDVFYNNIIIPLLYGSVDLVDFNNPQEPYIITLPNSPHSGSESPWYDFLVYISLETNNMGMYDMTFGTNLGYTMGRPLSTASVNVAFANTHGADTFRVLAAISFDRNSTARMNITQNIKSDLYFFQNGGNSNEFSDNFNNSHPSKSPVKRSPHKKVKSNAQYLIKDIDLLSDANQRLSVDVEFTEESIGYESELRASDPPKLKITPKLQSSIDE